MRFLSAIARPFVSIFLRIAEPRVTRIIQFGVYLALTCAGGYVLTHPPVSFIYVIGATLVYIFAGALTLGGIAGLLAVLPGVWWLERMGVVAIWTGLSIFAVIAIALGVSYVGFAVAIALGGSLGIRWTEIRRYEVAPRAE